MELAVHLLLSQLCMEFISIAPQEANNLKEVEGIHLASRVWQVKKECSIVI